MERSREIEVVPSSFVTMARALLIVPPFLKYSAGPLLGPALLKARAIQRGHSCSVVDMNAYYIRKYAPNRSLDRGVFVGDHDKPRGPSIDTLSGIETTFLEELCCALQPANEMGNLSKDETLRRLRFGFLRHDEVNGAGSVLARSSFGSWTRTLLESQHSSDPHVVGLSLLHAGQVIPAVSISMVVRELWPDAMVVWGGPHVSGLGKSILDDIDRRNFAADLFVTGHAEETFSSLLDQVSLSKSSFGSTRLEDGVRGGSMIPSFENLNPYDNPPVLPAQSTLGCAYGRCAFCTYPAMEPTPSKLDLCATIDSVVDKALQLGATVSIKDSLVTAGRLHEIGATIGGRVKWSACTKISRKLTLPLLERLSADGLSTLEVGLESLLVDTQRRVAKVHPPHLFEDFLRHVAQVPDLSLVVNYMTGFPWEDSVISLQQRDEAVNMVSQYLGHRGKLEHNSFELERLSPMAKYPERFHIDKQSLKFWPWASIVEYKAVGCRASPLTNL